ncbi:hypothetical protein V8E55_008644 [Tylopilus felleus]
MHALTSRLNHFGGLELEKKDGVAEARAYVTSALNRDEAGPTTSALNLAHWLTLMMSSSTGFRTLEIDRGRIPFLSDASVHRDDRGVNTRGLYTNNSTSRRVLLYHCLLFNLLHTMSEQQPSASQTSAPVEPQSADSDSQSPPHKPLQPTPPHPYRIYGYKLNNEWFAKIAKDHNIWKPHWDEGTIESSVLGYLTLRLPGFQIHFVDDPSDIEFGYSICISLATNWNRKKLERAASRVPKWMEMLGTEEKPRWYKPTVDTISPIATDLYKKQDALLPTTIGRPSGAFWCLAASSRNHKISVDKFLSVAKHSAWSTV